jgi:hypothetical protein
LVINAIIVILGIIKYSAKTDAPCGGKIYWFFLTIKSQSQIIKFL